MYLNSFESKLKAWCQTEDSVVAAAIVGSNARDEARPDSDIDVVILSRNSNNLLHQTSWLSTFGKPQHVEKEDWGAIAALRAKYGHNCEVEFGIGDPSWANVPADPGTRRVVMDGMRIIYDPAGLLDRLQNDVLTSA